MTPADLLALMPLIILTAGCVICLLAGAVRPGVYLYWTAMAAAMAALLWSVLMQGDANITGLSVTSFSRVCSAFLYGTGIIGLLLACSYNKRRGLLGEEYPATLLFALVGMGVTCTANDLLMLFLGLEAFTFAFYILVAIEPDSERGGEAGLKYLLNGTLSAAVMGMGMALTYAGCGTLKLAGIAAAINPHEPLLLTGVGLILMGVSFKLSLVPAHLWTPDVYQGAPAPVTALLSTASKASAAIALLILFPLVLPWSGFHDLLWVLALVSMLAGNLAALLQTSVKRMLAWSSIAQMGYVTLALVVYPSGGDRAALFYSVVYAAAGLASFGAVTVLSDASDRDDIADYRGLGYRSPLAGAALAVAMFSLAGIPPTAGFMAKFAVFSAALRGGEVVLALTGILSALISVFFYLRIVVMLYMKTPRQEDIPAATLSISDAVALVVPMLLILVLGVYPSVLLDLIAVLRS